MLQERGGVKNLKVLQKIHTIPATGLLINRIQHQAGVF